MMKSKMLYRWECRMHRKHGRWLKNGSTAQALASNHCDRTGGRCTPRIVNNRGRDEGSAI